MKSFIAILLIFACFIIMVAILAFIFITVRENLRYMNEYKAWKRDKILKHKNAPSVDLSEERFQTERFIGISKDVL